MRPTRRKRPKAAEAPFFVRLRRRSCFPELPTPMKLSIFDLDRTLLPIDSGDAWTYWLAERSGAARGELEAQFGRFVEDWNSGAFDALDFIHYQFGMLARHDRAELERWRSEFIDRVVRPAVRPEALALVAERRAAGCRVILATGTHRFVSEPIARLFGIEEVLAATPEERADGSFTGRLVGSDSFGAGKVALLRGWMRRTEARAGDVFEGIEWIEAWSDSAADLPLLEFAAGWRPAGGAVAVNPDPELGRIARTRGWRTLELFKTEAG